MISPKEIKAEIIAGGIARKNRFHVEIPLPASVIQALTEKNITFDEKVMSLRCYSTQLPPKSIATAESKIGGHHHKIPHGKNFDDVVMTFILDKKMSIKKVFDVWQDVIAPNEATHVAYLDDIKSNVSIYHLSETNSIEYSLILKGAYPIMVNALDYTGDDNDSYQAISVTWTFKTVASDLDSKPVEIPMLLETNSAMQEGLNIAYLMETLDEIASFSLQGEALKWYSKINDFIRQFTGGYGVNSMVTLVKRLELSVQNNSRFVDADKVRILSALASLRANLGF